MGRINEVPRGAEVGRHAADDTLQRRHEQANIKALVQAVKRNAERFPPDFMFQVTKEELTALRSQTVTSNKSFGRGGRRYLPYVFTGQGVAMLSSVLRSERAVKVNVEIMRAFVRPRRMLASHRELARKLAELEQKYDGQFRLVFRAIRRLMTPPPVAETPRRRIGFRIKDGQ